ncbi:MAG: GntR family transcriptional regulator [Abditibacteriota bacterium]|nr:GntR family transcriptional regulator [Abditibacteriota bacterium]
MDKKELVIEYIENKIRDGIWKPEDRIDPETKLAKDLSLSRGTVHEALSILCDKNILTKQQGSGTYVKDISSLINKKYILIVSAERYVVDLVGGIYRLTIEYVKELINKQGYTPIFRVVHDDGDLTDNIGIDTNEIAGVLLINAHTSKNIFKTIIKNKIPIVSFLNAKSKTFSSVVTDHEDMFYKLTNLIEKYKLKDIIAITHKKTIFERNTDVFLFYALDRYFYENYNLIEVPFSYDLKTTPKALREAFKKIKKTPDAIVFLDDTIYKSGMSVFPEFDGLLKKTKIITHSSGDMEFGNYYKICRLEFNLKEIAVKSFELLMKHINKEFIEDYNVYVKATVVNEEALA